METLVVNEFGTYIGKKSERAIVRRSDGTEEEYPLFRLNQIVVAKQGVAISSDLIAETIERGIRLTFLEKSGAPYAMLSSPAMTATVITRRAQFAAYENHCGVEFAKTIVRGKLRNQANLLKYAAKYLKSNDSERYGAIMGLAGEIEEVEEDAKGADGERIDTVRETLLGFEGNAGRRYWEGIKLLLRDAEFGGREHRGATDLINSLLNYGYGILYAKIWGALMNAGLEPFAGFLHTDRPGKPSLVLDCIEEFRQPVVDRSVLALVNKRVKLEVEDGLLTPKTRKILAEKVLERLDEEVPYEGHRYSLGSVIQSQARHLAMFFRDERSYNCYRFRW